MCGIVYNSTTYYFMKNLQGDVIAITNAGGTVVARYSYDAWGKCTITSDNTTVNIATHNPYRYRSYYYDSETELYYLQSRYYDPETARFVNADEAELIGVGKSHISYNLFTCCRNDVVNNYDPTGFKDINITKKLNKVMLKNAKYLYSLAKLYRWGSIAGVIALLYKFYSLVKTGGKWDFKNQKEWKLKSGDYYIYDGEKIIQ